MRNGHQAAADRERDTPHLPSIQLLGPRLIMREYRPTDAEAIWEAIDESRPSLARWVPDIARRHTPAAVCAGLTGLAGGRERGQQIVFGLWERNSGRFLGEVGLYRLEWSRATAEVGYWLRQTARGQGYVAEGLDLVCAQASRVLGLRHLEAHIAADNFASRRVAERHDFRVTGERPAVPIWDGETARVLIYTRALAPTEG